MATKEEIDWSECPLVEIKPGVQKNLCPSGVTLNLDRAPFRDFKEDSRRSRLERRPGFDVHRHDLSARREEQFTEPEGSRSLQSRK